MVELAGSHRMEGIVQILHRYSSPKCAKSAVEDTDHFVQKTHMDREDILAWLQRGLDPNRRPRKTQVGLARALNINDHTGGKVMRGERELKAHELFIAKDYLELPLPNEVVPLVGKVGAGAVHFVDGIGHLGEVEAPPNSSRNTVAVEVAGDSEIGNNAPNGSLIYYDDFRDPPDETLLDRLCVLWTADGRALLKRLIGREPSGLWTIQASNGSYERGVDVVAAARVKFIAPR